MMRAFENPTNGYQETVGVSAAVGVFFLGALYLAVKGLWRHVFIWLVVVVPLSVLSGGPAVLLLAPLAGLIYALLIQDILAKAYLAKGWREVGALMEAERSAKAALAAANTAPWKAFGNPVSERQPDTKKCPYCAEEVKFEAVKCKHCQSELPVPAAPATTV